MQEFGILAFTIYLSQQDEPSAGWAQHMPVLSSEFSLGEQHTVALFFGVQQDFAPDAGMVFLFALILSVKRLFLISMASIVYTH
jgi:hypothetical protein